MQYLLGLAPEGGTKQPADEGTPPHPPPQDSTVPDDAIQSKDTLCLILCRKRGCVHKQRKEQFPLERLVPWLMSI